MLFQDSRLYSINKKVVTNTNQAIDVTDIVYIIQTVTPISGSNVNTFTGFCRIAGQVGLVPVVWQRNSRTMAQFKTAINTAAPSNLLKAYTSCVYYSLNNPSLLTAANTALYNSTVLINDSFVTAPDGCEYDGTNTIVKIGNASPVFVQFEFTGSQLLSAVQTPVFIQNSLNAINVTGAATAAQLMAGAITSTSAAPVTITLPTATAIATASGATQGKVLKFYIDNSAGASTVTVAVNTGITADADLTTAAGFVGEYELYFTSATTAQLKGTSVSYADQTFTGLTTVANLNYSGILRKSGTPQTLTGAGAVNLTTDTTLLVTTAADALTLADGAEGQVKTIIMITDGGDGTLTPTSLRGYNTVTFNDVGDTITLQFQSAQWNVIANIGCTLA